MKTRLSTLYLLSTVPEVLARSRRKLKFKQRQMRRDEVKRALFTDCMIVSIRDPKD